MSQVISAFSADTQLKLESVIRRATADYIFLLDAAGIVKDCNDRFAADYSVASESPIGKPLSLWMSSEESRFAQKKWQRLLAGTKSERGSRRMKNNAGQVRIMDVHETLVMVHGQATAILGLGRDITDEAQLEEKLWETQETRDSAVEYAVRASLGLIKGYVYSMRGSQSLSESQRAKFGRVVTDEIEALSRTIENLLSARGLHADTQSGVELCDVKALLDQSISGIEAEALRRDIQICRDEPAGAVEMYVPDTAVVRLLQNLMEHCVMRITHDGRIHLKVQDSGEYVDIQISDNGSAVAEEQLRSLFLVRPASSRDDEMALGSRTALYVARLFAEAMGGAVSARASSEGGLEFHLMLPRQVAGFNSAWQASGADAAQTSAMSVQ